MKKQELEHKVNSTLASTHDALKLVWDNLNRGQQQKMLKNGAVRALLVRYGIVEE